LATVSSQEVVPDWISQAPDSRLALVIVVWARDGQAPARAQTLVSAGATPQRPRATANSCYGAAGGAAGATTAVQYMHRVAAIGIEERHSGQSRVVASTFLAKRAVILAIGATIRK
jgi:hypothetical protein